MRNEGRIMKPFDVAPFGLPNCKAGEVRFEEPRDIERVVVTFAGAAPKGVGLSYLRRTWPQRRFDLDYPVEICSLTAPPTPCSTPNGAM